jgi:putative endonuclease
VSYASGRKGEELAVRYLEGLGCTVLARNYRAGRGEIDVIIRLDERIGFVEVKSWKVYGMENLEYAVDRRKQARIISASRKFLADELQYDGLQIGYDLLFVDGSGGAVTYLKDAFTETGIL